MRSHHLRAAGGSKGGIIEQDLEFWIDPADTNSYSTSSPNTVTSLANSYVAGTNGDTGSFVSTMYGGAAPTNVTENGYNTWTNPANWWDWNAWSTANNEKAFFGFIENSGTASSDRLANFGTQNFTVECWLKPTQDKIPIEGGFKQGSSYVKLWQIYLWSSSGPQYSWWMWNTTNNQVGFYNPVGGSNTVGWGNNSNWYHFVFSADIANNNIKCYINSSLNKSETNTLFDGVRSVSASQASFLSIGGAQSEARYYEGSMGPVRIYLGKALTAAEVTQHWEHEKARFGY